MSNVLQHWAAAEERSGVARQAGAVSAADARCSPPLRIGLIAPYGDNLGDATIQESAIRGIRKRVANAKLYGIYLLPASAGRRHKISVLPVAGSSAGAYGVATDAYEPAADADPESVPSGATHAQTSIRPSLDAGHLAVVKSILKRVPFVWRPLKAAAIALATLRCEALHVRKSHRALKETDLVLVAGSGQIVDTWGGAWGHPFNLFKWSLLCRLCGVPYCFLSVGSARSCSWWSRLFYRVALRHAKYRSHRDKQSLECLSGMFPFVKNDPIVPDLAFGYDPPVPAGETAPMTGATTKATVGIGLIAYGRADRWPTPKPDVYERYLGELSVFVQWLTRAGHRVVFFLTAAATDQCVVTDVLEKVDDVAVAHIEVPNTEDLHGLYATLERLDIVVASRLHGVILSHLMAKPVIALSFDQKVAAHMQATRQEQYCLDIATFSAGALIERFLECERSRAAVVHDLQRLRAQWKKAVDRQFDHVLFNIPTVESTKHVPKRSSI
jgi:polysaccharide pyruvyl transferase WcaK-like protein